MNPFGRRSRRTYRTSRPRNWTNPKSVANPNLCVYIIGFASPALTAVKIGVTGQDDVKKRLKQLQTGNPWRLSIKAVIYRPDAYQFEELLHRHFRTYRIRSDGEWFQFPEGADPVKEITRVV